MKSTRWSTHCLAALVGACAIWASAAAQGQFFLDDFEDGNPADGSPVTWVADPPYDGGTHLIEQGSYVLTPDDVSDYPSTDFSELDLAAEGRLFRAVSVRTTARLLASQLASNLYIGLVGRSTVDAQGKQATGVWGAVRSGGRLTLGVFNAELNRDQVWQGSYGPVSTPIVGQDINLQLDIFADSAALTAWNVGDPRPAKPQIVAPNLPDYVPAQGRVGLWTGQNILARGRPMAPVAYHYLEAAPVPEPTCLAMIAIALAGCLRRPIRRSERRLACTFGATVLIAGLVVAGQPAHAATVFYDDFEDGSLIDENPVSWVVPQWIPNGQYRVENGDLILTASNIPPTQPGYNRARTEMDVLADDVNVGNLSLRTRLRGLSPGTPGNPYYIGVTVRDTLSRDNLIGSFISAYIGSDGQIGVGYVRDTTTTAGGGTAVNHPLVSTGLDFANQDVDLQLDVVNNLAMLTVWDQSQAKPTSPQIEMRLPSYLASQGTIGLWVFPSANEWNKPALFRFVEVVAIPEPSTLGLLGLAAAGGMGRTSRRRRPSER